MFCHGGCGNRWRFNVLLMNVVVIGFRLVFHACRTLLAQYGSDIGMIVFGVRGR